MTLTSSQLDELISLYAERVVDGMDHKTIFQFAYDTIVANMENLSESDVINELQNFMEDEEVADMLKQVGADPDTIL